MFAQPGKQIGCRAPGSTRPQILPRQSLANMDQRFDQHGQGSPFACEYLLHWTKRGMNALPPTGEMQPLLPVQPMSSFGFRKPRQMPCDPVQSGARSEEHTSELQSLMRISYAVFCLK